MLLKEIMIKHLTVFICVLFTTLSASAQSWPTRPIKLVVPFPPGGLIDNMARLISGKLRALAVTTQQRSNALPQVPTMEEAGIKGYQVSAWFGLAAPTGLPANIQTRIEQALQTVSQQSDTKASMVKVGAEPTWLNAQNMSQFMQTDYAQWKKVAQYAKITLD